MNGRITSVALIVALIAAPLSVQADADADLAAGLEALQQAQLEKALPLLATAAEALPKSVEAQLALGDCQIRLGHIDKALAQYRAVLKLSPDSYAREANGRHADGKPRLV